MARAAGGSSELSRLEDTAGELVDRAGAARRTKARISASDHPVHIGTPGLDDWLTATEPFPEEALSPGKPHRLTVVLTESELLPAAHRHRRPGAWRVASSTRWCTRRSPTGG